MQCCFEVIATLPAIKPVLNYTVDTVRRENGSLRYVAIFDKCADKQITSIINSNTGVKLGTG